MSNREPSTQNSHNISIPSSSGQHNERAPPQIVTEGSQGEEVNPRRMMESSPSSAQSTDQHTPSVVECDGQPGDGPSRTPVTISPKFLSFPDEIILRIFRFLNGFNTNGLFDKPHHAFALARTNTRLLDMFRSNLTRITPEIGYSDAPTLQSPHILSVVRLSGEWLREIHVPDSWDLLPYLSSHCPQLKKLSITTQLPFGELDMPDLVAFIECAEVLIPRLSSISILMPDPRVLRFLVPPPPELTLKGVSSVCMKTLMPILRDPPKKLYLEFNETGSDQKADFLEVLKDACSKMEEVTLISRDAAHRVATEDPLGEALKFLNVSRKNEDSKCMKMIISGEFMEMFKQTHPQAILEFSLMGMRTSFRNVGNRFYPREIPLLDEYLTQDLSHLQRVSVPTDQLNPEWKERLSGINLSFMKLYDPEQGAVICEKVKVLEITIQRMNSEINWEFLKHVKHVRVMGQRFIMMNGENFAEFLKAFANLLRYFSGESVSVHEFPMLVGEDLWDDIRVVPAMCMMIDRMKAFESRGGDASSLRAWALYRMRQNSVTTSPAFLMASAN